MKLSFRDLKQQKFTIDAEPSDTIGQVKEKIAAEKGWEASSQKLIYSGKILADANTVESYKIEEKGFIVCMVSKPKAAPAPKPAPPPATPAPASAATPAPPPAPHQPSSSTGVAAAASHPPATPTPAQSAPSSTGAQVAGGAGFNDPSAMLVGNRNQAVMQQMEAMGFGREESERALRAAYFNPDRAIEYLLNGIPETVQAEQRAPQESQQQTPQHAQSQQRTQSQQPQQTAAHHATSPTGQATAPSTTTGTAGVAAAEHDEPINLFEAAERVGQGHRGGGAARGAGAGAGAGHAAQAAPGTNNIDFLRNNPHFQQLRQLVQQQPAMLEPILQQLAEGNPSLAQMIGQNQEQFLQLLSEDLVGAEGGPMPPGAIAVTHEEAAAIQRLCDLGFSRDRVIQAYFACDKNEEVAANFLFEQPEDDDS